jgi:chaperonin cofactor prefoldin
LTRSTYQEFATLTPNNVVFKLVGPVLVKQEQAEAKSNVDKRLEFIREEMSVRLNFAAPSLIVPHRPLIANG